MREFFGPDWRMYYTRRGDVLIVMLGGGDKSTQRAARGFSRFLAFICLHFASTLLLFEHELEAQKNPFLHL
jgi:hypothetical protein